MNSRAAISLLTCLLAFCVQAQVPDPVTVARQLGPQAANVMQKMQGVQDEYAQARKEREAEREAVSKQIAREELDRAKRNAAALQSQGVDPLAAAEVATRDRLRPLQEQWKAEDAAFEAQAQADMQKAMTEAGLIAPMPSR